METTAGRKALRRGNMRLDDEETPWVQRRGAGLKQLCLLGCALQSKDAVEGGEDEGEGAEIVQVGHVPLLDVDEPVGILRSQLIQHRLRDVNPGDLVAQTSQAEGETTRANAQLEESSYQES